MNINLEQTILRNLLTNEPFTRKVLPFVAPEYFMPKNIQDFDVEYFDNLEKGIDASDVVMMLRIQKERIDNTELPSVDDYYKSFGLTYEKLKKAKNNVIVMHPGPINRNIEIESSLADDLSKSVINEQVENGVSYITHRARKLTATRCLHRVKLPDQRKASVCGSHDGSLHQDRAILSADDLYDITCIGDVLKITLTCSGCPACRVIECRPVRLVRHTA